MTTRGNRRGRGCVIIPEQTGPVLLSSHGYGDIQVKYNPFFPHALSLEGSYAFTYLLLPWPASHADICVLR